MRRQIAVACRNAASACAQKQAVASRAGPSPGPSDALQHRRDPCRRVDLDHAVEIADVDAQLERARRDDHAVARLGERRLGLAALVALSDECETNVVTSSSRNAAESSSTRARLSQNTRRFSPRCSAAMTRRGVGHALDPIDFELRRQRSVVVHHHGLALAQAHDATAIEQLLWVADRRGQADPLRPRVRQARRCGPGRRAGASRGRRPRTRGSRRPPRRGRLRGAGSCRPAAR